MLRYKILVLVIRVCLWALFLSFEDLKVSNFMKCVVVVEESSAHSL